MSLQPFAYWADVVNTFMMNCFMANFIDYVDSSPGKQVSKILSTQLLSNDPAVSWQTVYLYSHAGSCLGFIF